MTKIKLVTTYLDHKAGEVYDEDDDKAQELVRLGRAELVEGGEEKVDGDEQNTPVVETPETPAESTDNGEVTEAPVSGTEEAPVEGATEAPATEEAPADEAGDEA